MSVSRISTITTSSARGGRRGARLHGVEVRGLRAACGKSTLNRLELSAAGFNGKKARKIVADFARMDDLLVEPLVEGYEEASQQIVPDIDATEFELHGDQENQFFHGYYNEYCYLPVMMFVDRHPVLARLRTGLRPKMLGYVCQVTRVRTLGNSLMHSTLEF